MKRCQQLQRIEHKMQIQKHLTVGRTCRVDIRVYSLTHINPLRLNSPQHVSISITSKGEVCQSTRWQHPLQNLCWFKERKKNSHLSTQPPCIYKLLKICVSALLFEIHQQSSRSSLAQPGLSPLLLSILLPFAVEERRRLWCLTNDEHIWRRVANWFPAESLTCTISNDPWWRTRGVSPTRPMFRPPMTIAKLPRSNLMKSKIFPVLMSTLTVSVVLIRGSG